MKAENSAISYLPDELCDQIMDCSFFPELVADSVGLALGDEPVEQFFVHHEATFARENIGRHMSVLVLTGTRLIVHHTDEGNEPRTAVTTTESVPLSRLGAVILTRVVAQPEKFGTAEAVEIETWLTLNWQTARRVDVEPAQCADPNCEADHGYTGMVTNEDLVLRMSPAADGEQAVSRLVAFGTALQRRVG